MDKKIASLFLVISIAIFLTIVGNPLITDGMFMDGLWYAIISRNMSEGIGTFWLPFLTETTYPQFYEHPPLAFGIQSLFYTIFGDHILVERFYSFLTFLISGILIMKIWTFFNKEKNTSWIPIFFWAIIPKVSWGCSNNMLENTMMLFMLLSFLCYLYYNQKGKIVFILLGGLSLFLAGLTKGFVALYIWAIPFMMYSILREISFKKMFSDTLLLILSTLIPLGLLMYFHEPANHMLSTYFQKQVVGSIENVQTVTTRFAIILDFLNEIMIASLFTIILTIVTKRKFIKGQKETNKLFIFFLLIALCGVLPIMISMKQRSFYILSVYPFWALAVGSLLKPWILHFTNKIATSKRSILITRLSTMILSLAAILVLSLSVGKVGREVNKIKDCYTIIDYTGENMSYNTSPDLYNNYGVIGYYYRYGHVSLEKNANVQHEYLLTTRDYLNDYLDQGYQQIQLNTKEYFLLKK
jgi:4-amino-4-deoxy-L-arabinose transferase-like glycosyltransferase